MTDSPVLVIGVDGGGTKTACWLARADETSGDEILGKGQAGPGNPRAAGFDVAQANIDAAVRAAFANAGLPRTTTAAACLALAGAGRAVEQDRIRSWAERSGLADRVSVVGDAEPILAAASPGNVGVALICGTGSLAWGRNRAGMAARCGGWGYLLGDQGSAYAIAIAGLQAAVRAADDRGPATALLGALQTSLGAATPQELIERIHQAEMTRARIAELARVVFAIAESDWVAGKLLNDAALELAQAIAVVARRLELEGGQFPLALSGGVVLNQPRFRESIVEAAQQAGCVPATVTCVADPALGAVAIARQRLAKR